MVRSQKQKHNGEVTQRLRTAPGGGPAVLCGMEQEG